ncbi:CYTH and CHAD domain-containing protein [Rhodococcus ruber]|uniref:CYTH and CHAD domain-containing protein n=1 Tax=Rhodococcus TaxID=1827 RepID=UPI000E6AE799|nr:MULTISPECIES: CYTH and CHAD domain-containing protein [Rhodococcus]MDO2376967.1 CYTH and CHAD domain-containing protein [Rhodococcus ruber]AXY50750.1 hypothetical protein YT1_1312 [Rhodococcus ruber]MDO1477739.1 CYTH and CHAD domain-containing protein [Rhodococcus ruber]QRE79941.1 CYTH and CHAD domain-containing protein [Rhodococcus ruber]RQM34856.1 hypothetical protein TN91_07665 [Rhodococcus ruber]
MTMPPRIDTVEESERKYTVGHGQQLPDLSGLPGVDAHPEPELQQLSARYYDTDDLRLLRAGITLRRREGGHDAGWHTKLPAGTDTRTEVRFPLGDDTDRPPAELLALLRGVRRARPVTLAAALNTQRWRHRLIDEEGRVLAEVVVDDVSATREEGSEPQQWREIEVELASGGTELLDAVEERLTEAGITRAPSPSKLHRALADLLPAEEQVPGPAGHLRDYLRGELRTLELAEIGVRRDAPDSVHSMRKALRRIRSALQTYAGTFAIDDGLVEELRWTGRKLSPSRDLEVQWERLVGRIAEVPVEAQREAIRARVDEYFSARSDAARLEAVAALDSDRYAALLEALDTLIDGLAAGTVRSGAGREARQVRPKDLDRALARLAKKVSRRVRHAGEAATHVERDELVHRARKGAKRMRYAIEVLRPLHRKRAERALDHFDDFQDLLGEFQDSVVAREHLLEMVSEQEHTAESSFGLGVVYQRELEVGEEQVAHLERAWKRARRASKPLWR